MTDDPTRISAQPPPVSIEKPADDQVKERTRGMRMFDVLLYPLFNNVVVFGISVAATYLTNKGNLKNAQGELVYGKVGKFFHERGEWMVNKFKSTGMSEEQAQMSKMVFFSFADGSLVAPFIKVLEDRREKIAYWMDKKMGTTSDDLATYESEPKQGWASVVGGRLLTCSIVVPTAYLLDKTGLNNVLFNNPGRKMGEYVAKHPDAVKHFGRLDVPELFRVGAFEAFYTSVCTAGVYALSRGIAKLSGEHLHKPKDVETAPFPLINSVPPAPKEEALPALMQVESASDKDAWKSRVQHAEPSRKIEKKFDKPTKQDSFRAAVSTETPSHPEAAI